MRRGGFQKMEIYMDANYYTKTTNEKRPYALETQLSFILEENLIVIIYFFCGEFQKNLYTVYNS